MAKAAPVRERPREASSGEAKAPEPNAPGLIQCIPLCLARDVLDRIGDRWSVLVIVSLGHHGVLRFTELKRQVTGVSQRMLTVTLRDLERDGLVSRTVKPVVPPHVEYRLTAMGHSLLETVYALVQWANVNHEAVWRAREAFDARSTRSTQ
jgi:DNA-binding HxlR family transcriptional regulator